MLARLLLTITIVLFTISTILGCTGTSASPSNIGLENVTATIVEPDDGAKPVLDFVGQAKSTIDVGVYLLSDRSVLEALKGAAQRGIKVRVMLEEHPFGGGGTNATVARQLKEAGVSVQWSNPTFRFTHEKVIIVDRAAAAIMTLNLTRSAFNANREFAVIVNDPATVTEVQAIFDADWGRGAAKSDDPNLVVSPDNARGRMLDLVGKAQRTLDIYAEEMNDKRIEDALVSAAKRGVKVRVIMSPSESGSPDANDRGRAYVKQGGVDVHLVKKPYIHAKMILVDRALAFVGSENFSATSLDLNRELGLVVSNAGSLERIQAAFEKDWAAGR